MIATVHFILLALAVCSLPAQAQSTWGTKWLGARCGAVLSDSPLLEVPLATSSHGVCPAPRYDHPASINDASSFEFMGRGRWRTDGMAHTDFFGTNDDAGQANSSHDLFFEATDVVFTNRANPGERGIINGSTNYLVRAYNPPTAGLSNCDGYKPYSQIYYYFYPPAGVVSGAFTREGGFSPTISGDLVGTPNDFSWVAKTTSTSGRDLGIQNTLFIQIGHSVAVLYCDVPPAAVGHAEAKLEVALPCGAPVFNLPPGYTANSAQLGIVDNIRVNCTLEATLKVTKNPALGSVRLDWLGASPSTLRRAEDSLFQVGTQTLLDHQPATSFDDGVLGDGKTYFYLVQ